MTTQELLKMAADANPELVEKIASTLQELEAIAPEFMEDFTEDADAIVGRVNEKTKEAAGFFSAENMKTLGRGVLSTAVTTAVLGVGMAVGTDLYNAARRGLTSGRNWKRMIHANPDLKDIDLATARRSFKTVQKYAPDIASDPMTAGSLVYRMSHAVVGDHDKLLRDTIALQSEHNKAKYTPFDKVPTPKMDFSSVGQQVNFPQGHFKRD